MNAAASTGASTTDKITLAVISSQLAALSKQYEAGHEDIVERVDKTNETIKCIQIEQARHAVEIDNIKKDLADNIKPRIKDNTDDIESIQTKSNWWNGLNTALSVIAGALAGFFGLKS